MPTVSEITTPTANGPYNYPQYSPDNLQMQPYKQAWTPEAYPMNGNTGTKSLCGPDKKCILTMLGMGVIIGLFVCGIPLAVMTTLYLQQKSQTSNNTGSSGTNSVTSISLPSQCTAYTSNTDGTRNSAYTGCTTCQCDTSPTITAGWYRFSGAAGTGLITAPVSTNSCGTAYPGWFDGSFPSTIGSITSGTVCANYAGTLCSALYSVNSILITNCDGFYVFYLTPMSSCNSRYCTT